MYTSRHFDAVAISTAGESAGWGRISVLVMRLLSVIAGKSTLPSVSESSSTITHTLIDV
jgi:hypothetical protein